MLRFTLRDSQDDCQSTVHRNYRKKPTVSEIICVVRGFIWAKHVQVLNKSSPKPNSFSSLAFGLVSFLCAEKPPLPHLYCATTVHGSFSLDNLFHYTNVKVVPWYLCPSRVSCFSYYFSLPPLLKLEPLTVLVFAFFLRYTTMEVVSPFRMSWLECTVYCVRLQRKNITAIGFFSVVEIAERSPLSMFDEVL